MEDVVISYFLHLTGRIEEEVLNLAGIVLADHPHLNLPPSRGKKF
jgi:hypothetical protein